MFSEGNSSGISNSQVVPSSLIEIKMVPSSLAEIVPFFHVANEVEPINLRVAYLCRFFAFEKAHRLDPTSSGEGVREFKTELMHRLQSEDESTLLVRVEKSDKNEMRSYIQNFSSLTTAAILTEVLKAIEDVKTATTVTEVSEATEDSTNESTDVSKATEDSTNESTEVSEATEDSTNESTEVSKTTEDFTNESTV